MACSVYDAEQQLPLQNIWVASECEYLKTFINKTNTIDIAAKVKWENT